MKATGSTMAEYTADVWGACKGVTLGQLCKAVPHIDETLVASIRDTLLKSGKIRKEGERRACRYFAVAQEGVAAE
jgi:hypothetical protein